MLVRLEDENRRENETDERREEMLERVRLGDENRRGRNETRWEKGGEVRKSEIGR